MKELDYFAVKNIDEALEILSENKNDVRIISGGTDLVVRLKQEMVKEKSILDISGINDLKGIYEENGTIHVLPLTTHSEIIESPLIRKFGFILLDACKTIGSPQIRNRGTVGGNVANASPAGDAIPALICMEAGIKIKSKTQEKVVRIEDFFTGPGKTVLQPDEILVDIFFPKAERNEIGFFKKLGQRKGIAISIVNVASKLRVSGRNTFDKAVVAFGAVAPTVVRGKIVERAILDGPVDSEEKILYISRLAFREVIPITDVRGSVEYRRDMSTNLLYEGLLELFRNDWRM